MVNDKNIPIVFAADENYIFITCVAIYSLLKNAEDKNKEIYLVTDSCYSDEGWFCIRKIQEEFPMAKVQILSIDKALFQEAIMRPGYISITTMYRLKLSSVLRNYARCLYIDADTLILKDIRELLWTDIEGFLCAGVLDSEIQENMAHKKELGISDMCSYVNAGVLLMNLELMREAGIEEIFMSELSKGYSLQDQDIINKCCYGKIKLLPEKYNYFSRRERHIKEIYILHFSGGPEVRPWNNRRTKDDMIWWEYAAFFENTELYRKQIRDAEQCTLERDYRYIVDRCRYMDKIYIWGFVKQACRLARFLLKKGVGNVVGFVDNDSEKKGYLFEGIPTLLPSEVKIEDNVLIIKMVQYRKAEVDRQILSLGFGENNILHCGTKTDYYYSTLDARYYKTEIEDLMLMQYGIIFNQ